MEMTKHQSDLFGAGQKMSQDYPRYDFNLALQYAAYNDKYENIIMSEDEDFRFFKAGFDNEMPEWVTAIRYGEIPQGGRSKNWATGEYEIGVSCLKVIRSEKDYSLVHPAYEIQEIEKITIEGWYFREYGSDGEPILRNAQKIA